MVPRKNTRFAPFVRGCGHDSVAVGQLCRPHRGEASEHRLPRTAAAAPRAGLLGPFVLLQACGACQQPIIHGIHDTHGDGMQAARRSSRPRLTRFPATMPWNGARTMPASPAATSPLTSPFPLIRRLRFRFRAIDAIQLPGYAGSAWRGLLGHSLRQTVCVTRQPSCDGCLLLNNCVYSTFFESPPTSAEVARRYNALPHPFVLEPEIAPRRVIEPDEPLTLGINLIGPAVAITPYLIHAFERAGKRGLGRAGGRHGRSDGGCFSLLELSQEAGLGSDRWQPIYGASDRQLHPLDDQLVAEPPLPAALLRLEVQTPLRIKHHGRFIGPRQLTAAHLLRNLIARMAMLSDLYAPRGPGLDTRALFEASAQVEVTRADLRWHELTRYSNRQRTSMQMGGLLGRIELAGDGLEALWPLLYHGQWMHIGKGTSFGLGRYRID